MPSFGGLGRDLFALHLVTLELLLAFRFAKHIRRIFLLVGLAHCFLSCPSAVPPSLKLDKLLPPPQLSNPPSNALQLSPTLHVNKLLSLTSRQRRADPTLTRCLPSPSQSRLFEIVTARISYGGKGKRGRLGHGGTMAEMDEGQKRRLAAQIQAIRLLQREVVVPPSLMATVRGDSYAGPAQHPLPMQDELAVAALAHHDNAKQSPAVRREPWEGPTKSLDDEVVSRFEFQPRRLTDSVAAIACRWMP